MSAVTATWVAVLGASVGCYLLKLTGLSVPASLLAHPVVARTALLLPVALLSALVAVQVLGGPGALVADARLPALALAALLLWRGAPFLVVVVGAAVLAAVLRLLG